MATKAKAREWISARDAAKILGVGYQRVKPALVAGRVRRKQIPGMLVMYNRADVVRLLAASITAEGEPPKRPRGPTDKKNERPGALPRTTPTARRTRQPA